MEFSLDTFYRMNRRILIWVALIVLLWLVRGFFAVVFMTFVLAFIGTPCSRFLQRRLNLPRRTALVILVYLAFLGAAIGAAVFVSQPVMRETQIMIGNLDQTQNKLIDIKKNLVRRSPMMRPLIMSYVRGQIDEAEIAEITRKHLDGELDKDGAPVKKPAPKTGQAKTAEEIAKSTAAIAKSTAVIAQSTETIARSTAEDAKGEAAVESKSPEVIRSETVISDTLANTAEYEKAPREVREAIDDDMLRHMFQHYIDRVRHYAPGLAKSVLRGTGTLLLALLFSFLITLDITRLTRELQNLRESRLHDFYEQTAGPVVRFAYVVGRAFQAQAMIACCNTALTLVGLLAMGLPSVAMLAMIVFLCSFIPVLGVFISTTPIVLVALNAGGLGAATLSVVFICVVHVVEAYLLNPLVYGKHLKINPVLVLIILFIGHRAFGIWGMLLGVPVTHYFMHDVLGVPVWSNDRLARRERDAARGSSLAKLPRSEAADDDVHHPLDSAARVNPGK